MAFLYYFISHIYILHSKIKLAKFWRCNEIWDDQHGVETDSDIVGCEIQLNCNSDENSADSLNYKRQTLTKKSYYILFCPLCKMSPDSPSEFLFCLGHRYLFTCHQFKTTIFILLWCNIYLQYPKMNGTPQVNRHYQNGFTLRWQYLLGAVELGAQDAHLRFGHK